LDGGVFFQQPTTTTTSNNNNDKNMPPRQLSSYDGRLIGKSFGFLAVSNTIHNIQKFPQVTIVLSLSTNDL
jgi:hypothetical protein